MLSKLTLDFFSKEYSIHFKDWKLFRGIDASKKHTSPFLFEVVILVAEVNNLLQIRIWKVTWPRNVE